MNSDLENLPEHVRKALDTIDQWTVSVTSEWRRLHAQMKAAGISANEVLQVSNLAEIRMYPDSGKGAFYVLGVERTIHYLRTALQSGVLDIDKLPDLRRLTLEAFEACRNKISESRVKAERVRSERVAKLSEVLPKCIDEFGADVMQLGAPQKENKNADAFIKTDYGYVPIYDLSEVGTDEGEA